jgi:hypothetical protein
MTHATTTHDTWIDPDCRDRIAEMVAFIRSNDTATVLADMLPGRGRHGVSVRSAVKAFPRI